MLQFMLKSYNINFAMELAYFAALGRDLLSAYENSTPHRSHIFCQLKHVRESTMMTSRHRQTGVSYSVHTKVIKPIKL
jgi:hypothetical protein